MQGGLRVGLTGGLGSGKSTIARMFAALGVHTISADEIGRELMSPGDAVYSAIVNNFGSSVLRQDGTLDRKALATLAFANGRLEELNAIVHPAVIAAQERWAEEILALHPAAIAMVESALIFEVDRTEADCAAAAQTSLNRVGGGGGTGARLRQRFDKIILVTLPDEQKIVRYMRRLSPTHWDEPIAADARARLAAQIPDNQKIARSDYVIQNSGTLDETEAQVKAIFGSLQQLALSGAPSARRETR